MTIIDRNELLCLYNLSTIRRKTVSGTVDEMGDYGLGCLEIINDLKEAAVVEPVYGKWEVCSYFESDRRTYGDKCSVCKFEHYGPSINHYRYCPNCGAKMDGKVVHCNDCDYTYDCICVCCEEGEMVYCSKYGKHMNVNDTCIYGKLKG